MQTDIAAALGWMVVELETNKTDVYWKTINNLPTISRMHLALRFICPSYGGGAVPH
jgi:hypothetical protein